MNKKPLTTSKTTLPKKPEKKKERPVLSEEEIRELRETFDLFDEDKSGTIDPEEIKKALDNLGLEKRNPIVYRMISDLQSLKGEIDFDTFIDTITDRLGHTQNQEGLQKLFALYDTDGTGSIDFQKLRAVAKELGETMNDEEIREMMHHIHVLNRTENKEEISFQEFYEIVSKQVY